MSKISDDLWGKVALDYLIKKDISTDEIKQVMEIITKKKWIVRAVSYLNSKGYSLEEILEELTERGIKEDEKQNETKKS